MPIRVMELVRRPGYMKLRLHNDIESLDAETSGRRQRTGWRSRNASAFDTWPNYREPSANQRGASPDAIGRSMSQQLSHHDDFYHHEQEIFDSDGWWVSPAVVSQTRGRGAPSQRGTNTYQRGGHANQRGTNNNQRRTCANQCERGTNANQLWMNANQRGTNVTQRGTSANQRGMNLNQRGMNTYQRGTSANQRGTSANQRVTNLNQRGMNANQRGTFTYLRGSHLGAIANQRGSASQRWIPNTQRERQTSSRQANQGPTNQRGLPTSQGSRSMSRILPANRGGLSLNRRGGSALRGRTPSSHRETNVNRGRSSFEHVTPGPQRETPQTPDCLCDKLGRFKPRQPKVREKSPRRANLLPWRASVSDSALSLAKHNLAHQHGTLAAQRRSPVDQRGALADRRRSPAGQRGALADRRRSPVDKRRTLVGQRGTLADRRLSPADQRGALADQRRSAAGQRGALADRRRSPVDKRRTLVGQRGTLADRRLSPTDQRGALADQRRSPAGQRGALADRRRSPVDKRRTLVGQRGTLADRRLSPADQRGALADRRLFPVKKRGSLAGQREALRRRSPADRRGTMADQRGPMVDQRGSLADHRRSPVGQRETQAARRRSSADQRGTMVDQRGSLADQRGAQADQRGSPVGQRGVQADQRGSPVGQRGAQADRRRSSADQRGTMVDRRGSLVDERGSPVGELGPIGDQHEISQQPQLISQPQPQLSSRSRLSDSSPPKIKRGSTGDQDEISQQPQVSSQPQLSSRSRMTDSKVKFEKPPKTSLLKKLVERWRARISARKIKRKLKAQKGTENELETEDDLSDTLTPDELNNAETNFEGLDPCSLMFRDGIRRIDMVLAFVQEQPVGQGGELSEAEARHRRHRCIYQANLIKEGLELELEHESVSWNGKTWFLKVHIPWPTQLRMAEVIGLKLPTKKLISVSVKTWTDERIAKYQKRWYVRLRKCFNKMFDLGHIKPEPTFYMVNQNYRREEQFLVKDRYTQYSTAQRSQLVMQILIRAKYGHGTNEFGISRLLAAEAYDACFPLHEGEYYKCQKDGTYTDRQLLYLDWARPSKWNKRQPLCLVQRYFGDQIGLYYAWLGFYTKMLIAPAIVGSLCFLYGIASEKSGDNIPSMEICDTNGTGNITLCPMCDKACSYQKLSDVCIFSQMTYLVDNPATDEYPRPEYEAAVTTTRINPVTGTRESYRSPWESFFRRVTVSTVVFMMIAISIASVLGIITYRISMVAVIYRGSGGILREYSRLFTIMTAAVINLAVSETLIKIFTEVALVITNLENPRTQADYEDSVTFKMFIFEFINVYASIVYIAFFKGKFYDHPGDKEARKTPFLTIKGDICFHAGCLSELCIMLAVSMIGKQTCHNIKEMAVPMIKNWWRSRSYRSQTLDPSHPLMAWEEDYFLQDAGHMALYEEYLEMIMQYGFVTLFVAAFPLGPLCALINNICEIRLDAYKMVTQARRPLPERVEDIGAWYGLLQFLTYLAVVSNAFVIAYTSDFIPRMLYKYVHSPKGTLEGYVNFSLSWFNTSDFLTDWGADESEWDPPQCAYRGYRNPPNHPEQPYGLSSHFWHVVASRLSFVVVFEHLVFTLTEAINAIIPKVPTELLRQIRREKMLEKELKYGRHQDSTYVEYLKAMAKGKGLQTVKSGEAGVTINWKDEASKTVVTE